jgi:hypothetical protein
MSQESEETHIVTADEFGEFAAKQFIEHIKDKYEFKDDNIDWTIVIKDWILAEKEREIKEREEKLNSDFE